MALRDLGVVEHLNTQLTNELTAVNQYFLHARTLRHWGVTLLGKKEYEESIEEMHHADWLIERILFLGGLPNVQRLNQVLVGPPVDLSDLRDQPITVELLRLATDRIMTTVAGLLGQLRDETPPAELLDPRGTQAPRIGDPRRPRQEPRP